MYQETYRLGDMEDLENAIIMFKGKHPERGMTLFIMLFTLASDREHLQTVVDRLTESFPKAQLAGFTIFGSIFRGHMVETGEITFLAFESSDVEIVYYPGSMSLKEAGADTLFRCRQMKDLSGIGVLTNFEKVHAEPYLEMLDELDPSIPIFGGSASGNVDRRGDSFVFDKKGIYRDGILTILFHGKVHIRTDAILGWLPLGRRVTISRVMGDRIIEELGGRPARKLYEKYLHVKPARDQDLDNTTPSFPLVIERDGVLLPRVPITYDESGAVCANADCRLGEKAQLAYGDLNEIVRLSRQAFQKFQLLRSEGILIFSCFVRKVFLQKNIDGILAGYDWTHDAAGGYTMGEIVRQKGHTHTMNITAVPVAFTENESDISDREAEEASRMETVLDNHPSALQCLASFITETSRELEEANRKLAFLASHDSLTGLYNRRSAEQLLDEAIHAIDKNGKPLSAMMLDLDHFKEINDTYGHDRGDKVLTELADILRKYCPSDASACRWGGEEFVILLPGLERGEAGKVAEIIRSSLEKAPLIPDGRKVTASIGVTSCRKGETKESLYKRIDNILYEAKQGGRNRVYMA